MPEPLGNGRFLPMLKVYCDNDVTSAISQRDFDKTELKAITGLLKAQSSGKIILKTSRQSLWEKEQVNNPPV
jgi:hypothetical protein